MTRTFRLFADEHSLSFFLKSKKMSSVGVLMKRKKSKCFVRKKNLNVRRKIFKVWRGKKNVSVEFRVFGKENEIERKVPGKKGIFWKFC